MCGIAGIFTSDKKTILENRLNSMAASIKHRGPDSDGIWSSEHIGFAFTRLSIFDLSSAGNQPMHHPSKQFSIVFNGEIYNWKEIREKLNNNIWKSKTDTETILHAYAELGNDCFKEFNGMFSIAIWDESKKKLILARDRAGIKQLYYGWNNNELFFASEPKAFFAAGFPATENTETIYEYLRWGLIDHDEKTFYKDINLLKAGQILEIDLKNKASFSSYWNIFESAFNAPKVKKEDALEKYIELIDSSITLRLRADVEAGAAVSGGIDSSVLASLMTKQIDSGKLNCFTYNFDKVEESEGAFAKKVTDILNCNSINAILKAKEVPEYFENVIAMQDAPVTSIRVLAWHKLYESVKEKGIKILLEGNGGDELGAGYEYYYTPFILDLLKNNDTPKALEVLNTFMDRFKIPENKRLERFLDCIKTTLFPGVSTQDGVSFVNPNCINSDFLTNNTNPTPINYAEIKDWTSRLQYIDFAHIVLPRALRYGDRASMSSGCEARQPLLDHRIIEFAFQTEIEARITQDGFQRNYMREAANKLLSKEILTRPKITIVDPQRKWLKDNLKPWVLEIFNSKEFNDMGFFNPKNILSEFNTYCGTENPRTSFHLFQYINVFLWMKNLNRIKQEI